MGLRLVKKSSQSSPAISWILDDVMRYLDRTGQEITAEHWECLYRDLSYCVLRRDSFGSGHSEVATSWIGLQADSEPKPFIFLVERRRKSVVEGEKTEQRDWWFTCELAAMKMHEKLVEGIVRC